MIMLKCSRKSSFLFMNKAIHEQRKCCFNLADDLKEDCCHSFIIEAESPRPREILEPSKPPPTKKLQRERGQAKLPDTSSSKELIESHIWKEFPEDLVEAVIARLPVTAFFRFRSVCRKWNSFLSSNSFSREYSQVPQTQPWFYTITHDNAYAGALYDPSVKKWHHLSALYLPTEAIVLPVASAGGLVCFTDIGHTYFYVSNPLTQSFNALPCRSPVELWIPSAVGMTLNTNCAKGGYKVLSLYCNGEHEVYDSTRSTWARPGLLPFTIKLPLNLNFRSQPISIDSTVYFMRSDPDGIVSYNMSTGIWEQFLIPTPTHLSNHTLAECDGRILLVGLLTKNAATCLCIWELQKMTFLWKEVDRMPNIWCLEFYGKHVQMTCLGNKGLLMLSLRSRQMNRLIMYDMASMDWLKVPVCTLPRGKKRQSIAFGTAFYPCLTAPA